jgi:hypothetical protein
VCCSEASLTGDLEGGVRMKEFAAQDELEALARLREHERELDQQLEDARLAAAQVVAEARQSADLQKQEAESRLSEEILRLRKEAASQLEEALATVQDETLRRSEALRRTAERNRERALAWLLARVAGRDTS